MQVKSSSIYHSTPLYKPLYKYSSYDGARITFPSFVNSPLNDVVAVAKHVNFPRLVTSAAVNSSRSYSTFDNLITFPSLNRRPLIKSPGNDDVAVLRVVNCSAGFNLSRRSESRFGVLKKSPGKHDVTVVKAAMSKSVDDVNDGGVSKPAVVLNKTVELGILFGAWFLTNIYFNIYNKQVLKVFHYPMTISAIQFGIGSVIVLCMWMFNLYKKPKVSAAQLIAILPLAVAHTLGNLFTNMSLGQVSVSFTHTIKAMEPFFSVLFSVMFLGERPSHWAVLSLLPIVGGVALASMSEVSFNWAGFWSAMASNATNQSRNVLSKKLMVKEEESMDNITLFSIITIMSFLLLAPATLFTEGVKFTPIYLEASGVNVRQIYTMSLLAALCYHAYQQIAYMILENVSPVTHSVGNCVKRVVVIVSSVLFFRTPVSSINALGTGIGLAGVFLYSRANRIKPNPKTA